MNEVNIENFLAETEEYLRLNKQDMSEDELNHITELYDDLAIEFDRQQLIYELYH